MRKFLPVLAVLALLVSTLSFLAVQTTPAKAQALPKASSNIISSANTRVILII